LSLELIVRKLVNGSKLPEPLIPFEDSSPVASVLLETGSMADSISHIKTSPPRPPEATILL